MKAQKVIGGLIIALILSTAISLFFEVLIPRIFWYLFVVSLFISLNMIILEIFRGKVVFLFNSVSQILFGISLVVFGVLILVGTNISFLKEVTPVFLMAGGILSLLGGFLFTIKSIILFKMISK